MANWIGDFNTSARIDIDFTTVNTSGVTTAITGGSCCVRKVTNNTGTAGTLAGVGVAALTTSGGLNHLTIFTGSDTTFFASGADYHAYIGYGLVSGNDLVGYSLGQFSILNRSTTPANVLQWGSSNVSSAAAGIPKVDIDTIKTNPVVNGGTLTFPTKAIVITIVIIFEVMMK